MLPEIFKKECLPAIGTDCHIFLGNSPLDNIEVSLNVVIMFLFVDF